MMVNKNQGMYHGLALLFWFPKGWTECDHRKGYVKIQVYLLLGCEEEPQGTSSLS